MGEKLFGGTVTPAYGRDYSKRTDAERDFRAGKDFQLHTYNGSGYCSIRDFVSGAHVQIRYNGGRYVTVVRV